MAFVIFAIIDLSLCWVSSPGTPKALSPLLHSPLCSLALWLSDGLGPWKTPGGGREQKQPVLSPDFSCGWPWGGCVPQLGFSSHEAALSMELPSCPSTPLLSCLLDLQLETTPSVFTALLPVGFLTLLTPLWFTLEIPTLSVPFISCKNPAWHHQNHI